MALQLSTGLRNARLNNITLFGGNTATTDSPTLAIFGNASLPANCTVANAGTLICTIPLAGNNAWMNAAGSGAISKNASAWTNSSAGTTNVASYFRIFSSNNTNAGNVVMQGNTSNTGDGGDMTLDNINIASGQQVTVTSFVITDGNA